jgi:anthranilate phosphoribosyltransferase
MKEALAKIVGGGSLSEEEASGVMTSIMDGEATPAQIGGLLAALALRGETADEIVGFARTMRSRAVPIPCGKALDTCGTGGDHAGTFNISTIASLVTAACGVRVAKHGNRSASGTCGSADVLEALGVRISAPPEIVAASLEQAGWTFLFAPSFHAAARHATAPRKELGLRSVFNLLGPLTNPAHPDTQVVGVPSEKLTGLLAECLGRLGSKRAWVVCGSGLDELSLSGPTCVTEVQDGVLRTFRVSPEDAGLPYAPLESLKGGSPERNAAIASSILAGEPGPPTDVVLLNASAALVVAGRARDLREGVALARAALADGRAAVLLARVKEITAA